MATISAGNNGMDPWKLLSQYVKGQQDQQKHHEDRQFRRELQANQLDSAERRARMAADPQSVYDRTSARLRARLDNGFGPGSGRAQKDMTTNQTAQAFRQGLIEGGVTNPNAVALIMGNAQHESQFVPNALGDTNLGPGREAHGMMQWREGRFKALQDYAASRGGNWLDPKIQGGFAASELTKNPQYAALGAQLNGLKSMEGGQQIMRKYLGYNVEKADEPGRFASSQVWYKKDTGAKQAVAANNGYYRDTNDPTHIYRDGGPDGAKFQVTHMKDDQRLAMLQGFRKTYKRDADRMIVADPNQPIKNGMLAYKVFSSPPELVGPPASLQYAPAPAAPGMVPVAGAIEATPEPEVTGAVVPPVVDPMDALDQQDEENLFTAGIE